MQAYKSLLTTDVVAEIAAVVVALEGTARVPRVT